MPAPSQFCPPASARDEWRAVALPLAVLVAVFGAGWVFSQRAGNAPLGWPVVVAYAIALGWVVRAGIGALSASTAPLTPRDAEVFRDRHFWSRSARWTYAALILCDGFFLLELFPERVGLFFVFAGLAALFSAEIGLVSTVLAAWHLL